MRCLPNALWTISRRHFQRRHGRIRLREPDHVFNRARRSQRRSSTVLRRVPTAISVQELNARVLLNRRGHGGTKTPWNLLIYSNFSYLFVHRNGSLFLYLLTFHTFLWSKLRTQALEKLQRTIYDISATTKSYQIELLYCHYFKLFL